MNFPIVLAKSLIVSIFPTPAGPTIQPPSSLLIACVMARYMRLVTGVTTNGRFKPIYSNPYSNAAAHCLKIKVSTSLCQ
uniref:Uncharacterized protein n=1 Tax=Panstrongylus lignarius TaxID=156445 RepID=A0A224XWP8_9HEMI